MTLGYVELFDFDNLPQAALAFEAASKETEAPAFLVHLGESVKTLGGQYQVGIRLLGFMISSAGAQQNHKKVAELERKKSYLEVDYFLYRLDQDYTDYLKRISVLGSTFERNQRGWQAFLTKTGRSGQDPWGGRISLGPDGRVVSTTPHETVFKLLRSGGAL